MLILVIVVCHSLIALTAAKWWLRPLMLKFDSKLNLRPCKDSDFAFFCWTWSIVLALMGLYVVWECLGGKCHLVRSIIGRRNSKKVTKTVDRPE